MITAARLLAAAAILCACATEQPGDDDVLPALAPRPGERHCLAGVDIPAGADTVIDLPDTLSDTGCFTDVATLAPAPDLVPYLVRAPLWTDGVYKRRYLALPPGQAIAFRETGAWELPIGAALIKLFILETRRGDPDTRRPLEARFMIRTGAGWHFASYAWDTRDGGGAEARLSPGRRTETFTVEDGDHAVEIRYYFPDRDGCLLCHDQDTGVVLGPGTLQMNRPVRYAGGRENQLQALHAAGILDRLPADLAALPAMVDPADERAPLEARARSYLHGNCAHCHQPGGWTNPEIRMDLRYDVPLADSHTCGEPIRHVIYRDLGELVIDPGRPDTSNLLQRMLAGGSAAMPPTGQSLVDPAATELVRAWIAGLRGCS